MTCWEETCTEHWRNLEDWMEFSSGLKSRNAFLASGLSITQAQLNPFLLLEVKSIAPPHLNILKFASNDNHELALLLAAIL